MSNREREKMYNLDAKQMLHVFEKMLSELVIDIDEIAQNDEGKYAEYLRNIKYLEDEKRAENLILNEIRQIFHVK